MSNSYDNSQTGVLTGLTSVLYSSLGEERRIRLTDVRPPEPLKVVNPPWVQVIPQEPRNEGELIMFIDRTNDPAGIAEMLCAVEIDGVLEWKDVAMGSGPTLSPTL